MSLAGGAAIGLAAVWQLAALVPVVALDVGSAFLLLAGGQVEVGLRMANGCSGGHGVCGVCGVSGSSSISLCSVDQPFDETLCLINLPFSLSQSRSFSVLRLSCSALPLASAISALMRPPL